MTELKRITPDQVVEAYERTGWHPIQDAYYDEIDGNPCGCGLAVMVGKELDSSGVADYAEALGLDNDYASGFVCGFDGETTWGDPASPRMIGYQDGRAAWEAVKREVLDVAD